MAKNTLSENILLSCLIGYVDVIELYPRRKGLGNGCCDYKCGV